MQRLGWGYPVLPRPLNSESTAHPSLPFPTCPLHFSYVREPDLLLNKTMSSPWLRVMARVRFRTFLEQRGHSKVRNTWQWRVRRA